MGANDAIFVVKIYEHAQLEEVTITFGLATHEISAVGWRSLRSTF